MKVNLVSTDRIEQIGGIRCRVWQGVTEKGVACFAFIPVICAHKREDQSEFLKDLTEHITPEPEADAMVFDLRKVL